MRESEDVTVLTETLKKTFGYDDFYNDDQKRATLAVFGGVNDVYIDLRPGTGKSICFQLPAVLKKCMLTVVFVPTHILGEAQVAFLKRKNINAEYLYPRIGKGVRDAVLKDLRSDNMKLQFLYASTDKSIPDLVNNLIIEVKARNALSYIVFDEAHCISHLSHHYMPTYRDVAQSIKLLFPDVRKIAVTGTATVEVRTDVIRELGIIEPEKIYTTSQWPINHEVHFIDTMMDDPFEDLKDFINKHLDPLSIETSNNLRKCGLIFCRKREAIEMVTRKMHSLGISVTYYHGGLSIKKRRSIRDRWIAGEISVLATTLQYGIGIHRPNTRFVVHWGLPMSVQQYYQQSGRTSQDRKKSSSRLYFSLEEEQDILIHLKSIKNVPGYNIDKVSRDYKFFREIIDYCFQTECRSVAQMKYLEQDVPQCRRYCDACLDPEGLKSRIDRYLTHRSLLKEWTMHQHPHAQRKLLSVAATPALDDNYTSGSIQKTYETTALMRQQSYKKLVECLMKNSNESKAQIEKTFEVNDIPEIARQLELTLFSGTVYAPKYIHAFNHVLRAIRNANASKELCGYLKYYEAEEKSPYKPKLNFVEPMKSDANDEQSLKSAITFNHLVSDNDSGSETE